jgi:hypothetical protein
MFTWEKKEAEESEHMGTQMREKKAGLRELVGRYKGNKKVALA